MLKIIIASGPVIVEDNKVLLVKHGDDNFWKFCGGRVEEFEKDLKETAKREAKEELGLEIAILNNEPYFFYTEKEMAGESTSVILAHFSAKRLNDIAKGFDTREFKWIKFDDLEKEALAPNIKPVLKNFGFLQ